MVKTIQQFRPTCKHFNRLKIQARSDLVKKLAKALEIEFYDASAVVKYYGLTYGTHYSMAEASQDELIAHIKKHFNGFYFEYNKFYVTIVTHVQGINLDFDTEIAKYDVVRTIGTRAVIFIKTINSSTNNTTHIEVITQ